MRAGLTCETGWAAEVDARLHRRLTLPAGAPVALALSGGGDSMALLHLAADWSRRRGRPLVALTVDHGLQPESAAWAEFAAERSRHLGVEHQTLRWVGEKPSAGLPAAARVARHALLATAARGAGADVVLMAHTADDLLEAAEMRREGSTTPSPAEWAPSPAWPEGRGIFLLRPLLGARRAQLRAMLATLGVGWIEDPANDDPRFSRARARQRLASTVSAPGAGCAGRSVTEPLDVDEGLGGELSLSRRDLLAHRRPARVLSMMVVCAAGGEQPPRRAAVERLLGRLAAGGDFVSSLAGARLEARVEGVTVCREAGERARGGRSIADTPLLEGDSVFDGRFLVTAPKPGQRIGFLRGRSSRLSRPERQRLSLVSAGARGALPVVIAPDETLSCPILAQNGAVTARPLGRERLRAAMGVIEDEASLRRVAKPPMGA